MIWLILHRNRTKPLDNLPMDDKKSHDLEALHNLWDEYEYRHNLIWQRIFIFTTAVVSISILPYIQETIVKRLGNSDSYRRYLLLF